MTMIGKIEMSLNKLVCVKCGYKWIPRVSEPKECPQCKSRYWKNSSSEKTETLKEL